MTRRPRCAKGYRFGMRFAVAALVAALMIFGAGCGGGSPAEPAGPSDSASVATDEETSAKPTPKEVVARFYFAALVANDVELMARAQRSAASGSLAQVYMKHQMSQVNADLDGGTDVASGELFEKGDGFEICYDNAETGEPNCYTYDKFEVDGDGRLAGFTVNGRSLAGRIILGSGKVVDSSVAKVTVLSAYQTASGYLAVAVKLRAKGAPVVFLEPIATYRTPSGQQRAVAFHSGLTEVTANSQSTLVFYFKGSLRFGGSMTLQMATHRSVDHDGDATMVPVKVG